MRHASDQDGQATTGKICPLADTRARADAGSLQDAGSPEEALRRAARLFVDFCAANPPRYQLLFLRTIAGFEPSPASNAPALETLQRTSQVLTDDAVTMFLAARASG